MKKLVLAAFVYFILVFGVGFVLGTVRILTLVPILGERYSELAETPFMLLTIFIAARWVLKRFELGGSVGRSLIVGGTAAILLLMVEFTVVLWFRGLTISEFMANRDRVAAAVYYTSVGIYAILPALISKYKKQAYDARCDNGHSRVPFSFKQRKDAGRRGDE